MTTENPVSVYQKKQLLERVNMLKTGFAALEKLDVRTIPEHIFKKHFLEFFCGEITEHSDDLISHWIIIAGTNYSPVNIVDAHGNFIIQVPPIHDRQQLQPITSRDVDLAYTFKVAKEKSNLSPNLANNIIYNELDKRYDQMTDANESNTIKNQWLELFKHYGKLQQAGITGSGNVIDTDDEFDF